MFGKQTIDIGLQSFLIELAKSYILLESNFKSQLCLVVWKNLDLFTHSCCY